MHIGGVVSMWVAMALYVAAVCLPARAQDEWPGFDFSEELEVRVVEVDVRVVNKKGEPIEGLTADDFQLFEDGRPVEIEYFSVIERASASRPTIGDAAGAPAVPTGASPHTRQGRPLLALLLDQRGLIPAQRDRVLDDLERFVTSLDGAALMTLLTTDGGLSVEVQPTLEAQRIREGLEAIRRSMAKGFMRSSEEDRAVSLINDLWRRCNESVRADALECESCWREMVAVWRDYAEEQAGVSRAAVSGLGEAVKTIGSIEGRKDLVYVSSGLKRMPGIALNEYVAGLCPAEELDIRRATGGYDLAPVLHQLTALANASRVTIHTLDAGGIRPLKDTTVRGESARFRFSRPMSQMRVANLQSGLFTVADDTGGRAILNENQPFEALAEVGQDLQTGYVLGYSPDRPADQRKHIVDVELRKPKRGIQLSWRHLYVDRRVDDLIVDRLLAALQLGWGENPLGVGVAVGTPKALEKGVVEAPIRITAPIHLRVEGQEGTGSKLRVVAVAMDSKGRRTVVRRKEVEPSAEAGAPYTFVVRMKLPPERYRFAVSIESEETGQTSYVVAEKDLSTPT